MRDTGRGEESRGFGTDPEVGMGVGVPAPIVDNYACLARRGSTSTATTTRITIRPHDARALTAPVSIGAIFFLFGRTKVEGWLTVTDGTYSLFWDEYKLPLIPVEIAWIANVDRGVRTWIAGSGFLMHFLGYKTRPQRLQHQEL